MKLYIGCSLTHATEDFRKEVDALKNNLRLDYEILDFFSSIDDNGSLIQPVSSSDEDVYMWDIHACVKNCDVFIAIVDQPSIGLGYELGTAIEKLSKPTLALAHKDTRVTRLVLGINHPNYKLARYTSITEIPSLIKQFIESR